MRKGPLDRAFFLNTERIAQIGAGMQARLKWWLAGIILLTLASLLAILRPVTLRYRLDPNTGDPIEPRREIGKFKLYLPHPDLRLGLDLRGGTQLRLQLQKSAMFNYSVPQVAELTSDEDRTALQGQIGELLSEDKIGKRDIEVRETGLRIITRVKDKAEMARQQEIIDAAISSLFPEAKHLEDSPEFIALAFGQLSDVKEILENRINVYGVSEAVFQSEEPDKILVEIPGVKDPKRARDLLQTTAVLEFRHIPPRYQPGARVTDPKTGEEVYTFYRKLPGGTTSQEEVPVSKVLDESTLILTGRDLRNNAQVSVVPGQETSVVLEFKPSGVDKWARFTRTHVGQFVAGVLDGKIIVCAEIIEGIPTGHTQIKGGFDGSEGTKRAKALEIKLNAGALPVDILPVEQREVSATLGEDSLQASLIAGLIGMVFVLAFMIAYYRLPGLLASIALIIYCILLLAALKSLDATLTLPGIFGVILSIGMAVDANIIIFERLKEELRTGKTMRAAIEAAFKRAWTAILDSNVCSILTGAVLYQLGTGPVKGFAITLVIGVAVSMFTAVTVTRLFMDIISGSRFATRPSLFGVSEKELQKAR
jgi:protein-export membrane protein SecD